MQLISANAELIKLFYIATIKAISQRDQRLISLAPDLLYNISDHFFYVCVGNAVPRNQLVQRAIKTGVGSG